MDVVIEYMPKYLRSSHTTANNSGAYPHNGASRYTCSPEVAEDMMETFAGWCRIVPGADPAEYPAINGYPE